MKERYADIEGNPEIFPPVEPTNHRGQDYIARGNVIVWERQKKT